ncbi:MAG: outer membrane protein assembly factor BamB family protein [Solirubrobacteraceae bacterium]
MDRPGAPHPPARSRSRALALIARLIALATTALAPAVALAPAAAAAEGAQAQPAAQAPAPWPSMRHDQHNTARSTIAGVYRGGRPWSFRTGRGLFVTPIVGGDGAIYFGSADHSFYALNPNGTLRWRFPTGNIIDAAGALDPSQRSVTIGSADENLYHLSTNPRRLSSARRVLWKYHARLPPATGQLVDWWEDNVAYGPDGDIYTGNTGGVIYSFTPSGRLRWTFRAGNSVWTMPAFGADGHTFWGSVDRSIYGLSSTGSQLWNTGTVGFVVSSPAIGSDGTVYIGSFDSKLYALDPTTGKPKWSFGTNDHIYSSPALGRDAHGATDTIYLASTDGSVYALTPQGNLRWSYDTGEPIRSSPVLGPAPGAPGHDILYVGSSDGSVYALDANTGRRRWSYDTVRNDPILRDRHELNSSPALGRTGVYIGSEDGYLTYVPYDYCLHRAEPRCSRDPGAPYPARLTRVVPVTAGGTTQHGGAEGPVPTSGEITGRLIVRSGGRTTYAAMIPRPSTAALFKTTPSFPFTAQLSGDGRYVFVNPTSFLAPSTTYRVTLGGRWGADGVRVADWTQPNTWTRFGDFHSSFSFRTARSLGPLPLHSRVGQVGTFELRRLAMPLPAFLPSVNQIGFDSYVLLVGALRIGAPDRSGTGRILLWATQARQGPGGRYLADPKATLVFPLAGLYRRDTLLLSVKRALLTFSFGQVPLQRLDLRFQLDHALRAQPGASIYAEADCAQVPNYGAATRLTGICNEQGLLAAAGTFMTNAYPSSGGAGRQPRGLSVRSIALRPPAAGTAGSVTVRFRLSRGARYPAADHRIGILLVDGSGEPLGLDYTNQTTSADAAGNVAQTTLSIPSGTVLPAHVRAYVISDVYPLSSKQLF